jgi:thiol-disulfide isomerase/thioredoxin
MKVIPFILALVVLFACGRSPNGGDTTPVPPQNCDRPNFSEPVKATLVLFGAPPCSNCHRDFPLIQKLVDDTPKDKKVGLKLRLFVETGSSWTSGPTQNLSDAYRASLNLCMDSTLPDGNKNGRPTYENYTKFTSIPISEMALPSAVILDKDGKVVEVFHAGGTTFVPQLIVSRALEQLGK